MGDMVTGGQLVARMLKKEGVRHIFTLSGLHVAPIYAGCVEEGIQVIDTRHEQAAAHAADAYARVTRGVGVAVVTAGWLTWSCMTVRPVNWIGSAPTRCF